MKFPGMVNKLVSQWATLCNRMMAHLKSYLWCNSGEKTHGPKLEEHSTESQFACSAIFF